MRNSTILKIWQQNEEKAKSGSLVIGTISKENDNYRIQYSIEPGATNDVLFKMDRYANSPEMAIAKFFARYPNAFVVNFSTDDGIPVIYSRKSSTASDDFEKEVMVAKRLMGWEVQPCSDT